MHKGRDFHTTPRDCCDGIVPLSLPPLYADLSRAWCKSELTKVCFHLTKFINTFFSTKFLATFLLMNPICLKFLFENF